MNSLRCKNRWNFNNMPQCFHNWQPADNTKKSHSCKWSTSARLNHLSKKALKLAVQGNDSNKPGAVTVCLELPMQCQMNNKLFNCDVFLLFELCVCYICQYIYIHILYAIFCNYCLCLHEGILNPISPASCPCKCLHLGESVCGQTATGHPQLQNKVKYKKEKD